MCISWSMRLDTSRSHVFVEGDKYVDTDVVFGVKDELIAKVEKRNNPTMPDGKRRDALASLDL
jgi:hydroxyquinol 1,2-dioxygenase